MLQDAIIDGKDTIFSKTLNDEIVNIGQKTFKIPLNFSYNLIEVTSDIIARPDIISYNYYGTDMYTGLICKLNGISNPLELNEGDILMIPNIADIDYFFSPDIQVDNENDLTESQDMAKDIKPIQKSKKQKRRPNEAVIGDSRYKLDNTNKIIIY